MSRGDEVAKMLKEFGTVVTSEQGSGVCHEAVLWVKISFSGTSFLILVFGGEIRCFCANMLIYTCDVGMPLGGVAN